MQKKMSVGMTNWGWITMLRSMGWKQKLEMVESIKSVLSFLFQFVHFFSIGICRMIGQVEV